MPTRHRRTSHNAKSPERIAKERVFPRSEFRRPGRRKRRSKKVSAQTTVMDNVVEYGLYILVALTPLLLGAPSSDSLLFSGLCVSVAVLFGLRLLSVGRRSRIHPVPWPVFGLWILAMWCAIQALPF